MLLFRLFFKAITDTSLGRFFRLDRFRDTIHRPGWKRRFDAIEFVVVVIVTFPFAFLNDDGILSAIGCGAFVGLSAGFFAALRPKHIEK
jgi:hypothetical protein